MVIFQKKKRCERERERERRGLRDTEKQRVRELCTLTSRWAGVETMLRVITRMFSSSMKATA